LCLLGVQRIQKFLRRTCARIGPVELNFNHRDRLT
jgi:hypothetical protein